MSESKQSHLVFSDTNSSNEIVREKMVSFTNDEDGLR